MPNYTKGQYNGANNSYIRINRDDATYSLVGATQEEYQNNNGSVVFTEDLRNLNRNVFNISLTNSQRDTYLSGPEGPLSVLERTRTDAQTLYWKTLGEGDRSRYLQGEFGNDWKGKFDTESSADLQNNTNFGPQTIDVDSARIGSSSTNLFSADAVGGSGAGTNFAVLKYPIDMDLDIQDHLAITVAQFVPAGRLPGIRTSGAEGQFVRTRNNKLKETILLPIPNAPADSNQVSFGEKEMTSASAGLFGPIAESIIETQPGAGGLEAMMQAGTKLAEGLGQAVQEGAGSGYIKRRFLLRAAAAAANVFNLNVDVDQVIARTTGAVPNPNLELLFQGPGVRDFNFNVRFTPRSKEESRTVRTIIRVLKQRMAVKRNATGFDPNQNQGGENLLLGTPDVFRLEYRRGSRNREEIKGLNKFKTCALTALNVDYMGGSGRWSAYADDSQPVTTLISMSFRELVPIYQDDYVTGNFASDDVGF